MPNPVSYPWSALADIDRATAWCEQFPTAALVQPTAQGMLLMARSLVDQGHALFEQHWSPERSQLPAPVAEAFGLACMQMFSCLLMALAARRRNGVDPADPAPSMQLSVAHLARQLEDGQAKLGLPADVLGGLASVEAARHAVLLAAFAPGQSPAPVTEATLEQMVVATGRLVAAIDAGQPWAQVFEVPAPAATQATPGPVG